MDMMATNKEKTRWIEAQVKGLGENLILESWAVHWGRIEARCLDVNSGQTVLKIIDFAR